MHQEQNRTHMDTGNSQELEKPDQQGSARDAVIRQISSWEGISMHEHRFGGVEFRLNRRELGHLHSSLADLPLPRHVRDDVVASGKAKPHHVLPNSGWVTVPMRTASEAENVIGLFRFNYERAANAVNERSLGEDLSKNKDEKDDGQ
jgi:hypothetical protein